MKKEKSVSFLFFFLSFSFFSSYSVQCLLFQDPNNIWNTRINKKQRKKAQKRQIFLPIFSFSFLSPFFPFIFCLSFLIFEKIHFISFIFPIFKFLFFHLVSVFFLIFWFILWEKRTSISVVSIFYPSLLKNFEFVLPLFLIEALLRKKIKKGK